MGDGISDSEFDDLTPPWTSSADVRKQMAKRAEALANGECFTTLSAPRFCCTHLCPMTECSRIPIDAAPSTESVDIYDPELEGWKETRIPRPENYEAKYAKEVMLHAVTKFELKQAVDLIRELKHAANYLQSWIEHTIPQWTPEVQRGLEELRAACLKADAKETNK